MVSPAKPPQISANDLARYMVAGETGKIGIIRCARDSGTPAPVRYSDARRALTNALIDPKKARGFLETARDMFEQRTTDPSLKDWRRNDAEHSIDVLDAFEPLRNMLVGKTYVTPPRPLPKLPMGGMLVSVNLDLVVHHEIKGVPVVGGLLLRMSKPDEDETEKAAGKRREMGLYAATLAYLMAEEVCGDRQPAHSESVSVDVQCGEIHAAPRNFKKRMSDMESACKFIRAMWYDA